MFFNEKIEMEKVQLTGDLKDDIILYQAIRLNVKMIRDIVILPLGLRQAMFDSLKTRVPPFKSLKSTQKC